MKEIIKGLGITVGSFYRYFGSKEELYIYLIDREAEKFHVLTEGASSDPHKVLSDADVVNLSPEQGNFWLMFYHSSLEIRRKYYFRTAGNPIYCRLRDSLRSLLSAVDIPETEIDTSAFLLFVLRYIVSTYHKLTDDNYNEDKMLAFLQEVIIRGLESIRQ
jgi:AcrR family transcriptional regulator